MRRRVRDEADDGDQGMRRSRTIRLPDGCQITVRSGPVSPVSIWSHPVLDPSLFSSSRARSLFGTAFFFLPAIPLRDSSKSDGAHVRIGPQHVCEWLVSICEECRVWQRLVATRHSLLCMQARLDVAPAILIVNAFAILSAHLLTLCSPSCRLLGFPFTLYTTTS